MADLLMARCQLGEGFCGERAAGLKQAAAAPQNRPSLAIAPTTTLHARLLLCTADSVTSKVLDCLHCHRSSYVVHASTSAVRPVPL